MGQYVTVFAFCFAFGSSPRKFLALSFTKRCPLLKRPYKILGIQAQVEWVQGKHPSHCTIAPATVELFCSGKPI